MLLLIICYGIFSNYKSKIDKSSLSILRPQNNLESTSKTKEEFGCINEGGIIKSSYCRFSKTKCKENMVDENKIYIPYFGAAITKLYIEKLCLFFSRICNTKFSIIRHSNIYGPYDKFDIKNGHFIGSSFKKILSKKIKSISIFGQGTEKRDYLYVDDLITFVEKVLQKQKNNYEIFNCSYGKSYSILSVLKKIIHLSLSKKKVIKKNGKNLAINILVSNTKAKRKLNWSPKYSLDEGLKKTLKWYRENYN